MFIHYTPLTKSWGQVLEEACSVELIQLLAKNWPPPGADKSKYCCYHRVVGHNIEKCTTLKDKIEEMIQNENLQIFVKDKDPHMIKIESEKGAKNTVKLKRQQRHIGRKRTPHLELGFKVWSTQ